MDLYEAFLELTEDVFNMQDNQDIEALKELEALDEDDLSIDVIDADATVEDDLKPSYLGKAILGCTVCHSLKFINIEDIEFNDDDADLPIEERIVNIEDTCDYCQSNEGFNICGKVVEFREPGIHVDYETDEQAEEGSTKEEPAANDENIESEEETAVNESLMVESKADIEAFKAAVGEDLANRFLEVRQSIPATFVVPEELQVGILPTTIEHCNDMLFWKKQGAEKLAAFLDIFEAKQAQSADYSKAAAARDAHGPNEIREISRENGFVVYKLLGPAGAAYLGRGTKWCISGILSYKDGKNGAYYFNDYKNNRVSIYVVMHEEDADNIMRGGRAHKWAICSHPSDQGIVLVFDENNDWVNEIPNFDIAVIPGAVDTLKGDEIYNDGTWKVMNPINSLFANRGLTVAYLPGNSMDEYLFDVLTLTVHDGDNNLFTLEEFDAKFGKTPTLSEVIEATGFLRPLQHMHESRATRKYFPEQKEVTDITDENTQEQQLESCEDCGPRCVGKRHRLEEGFNNLDISTEDERLTMSQDPETKKVTITTEPISETVGADSTVENEVIGEFTEDDAQLAANGNESTDEQPEAELDVAKEPTDEEQPTEETIDSENDNEQVTADDEQAVLETSEELVEETEQLMTTEDIDISVDELDECKFNKLSEQYLKNVYDNVAGFETKSVTESENGFIVEGLIEFTSGNKADTLFVFEAATATADKLVKFTGYNKQLTENKNAFTLTGHVDGSNLVSESLAYTYKNVNGLVEC